MSIEISSILALLTTFQVAGGNDLAAPIVNSLNEFGTTIGRALPNIVAALVLLGIGYLVGKIAGWAVSKVIKKLNLDKHWSKSGIGQATVSTGWSMSRIFGTATKWFIYLFFIAAAVNVLQFPQISQAINSVWLWVPNVVAFLLVLVIGSLLADFVGSWLQNELPRRGIIAGKTIGLAITGIFYAIVLTVAVTQLGIGQTILNSVITALVWGIAAALAIGFGVGLAYGLKEAIPSIIKGNTLVQPAIKQGQKISFNQHRGVVQEVGAFSVIIKDEAGRTVVIPTKNLIDEEIIVESGPNPETQERMMERGGGSPSSYSAAA
ncbi:mechanosensitive ion channel family protein [Nitrososphaera viennensis]|uniref:Mechanosensitive ion channel n=2 Tax=Nitrososphaera viennensis TaxID=1034015 RepID=A0A977IBW6_9ARCH|nr:mechanosensitive ion channel domain-containing protein [Nitrososphaera viennensis]AIC15953.1 putative small-conductance mechanosensitive ion channel [Nitrososphaera viennensis EN76]UVS67932.1 mechanosensitive ion channel [Nitrososphaera viennensis]